MNCIHKHDAAAEIAAFIDRRFPAAGGELSPDTPLLDGLIDSLGILELMMFLGETYGIEIGDGDFAPENFETIGHLVQLVERKRAPAP